MVWNAFPQAIALNEASGDVLRGGIGQVYNPTDLARTTPLPVLDLSGQAIPGNAPTTNSLGLVQRFMVENLKRVIWKSGGTEIEIISYEAVIRDAEAAVASAASSAAAAIDAVGGVTASGDSAVASYISDSSSATRDALAVVIPLYAGAGGPGCGVTNATDLQGPTWVTTLFDQPTLELARRIGLGLPDAYLGIGTTPGTAAEGSKVVYLTGNQTVAGVKVFSDGIQVKAGSLSASAIPGLQDFLAAGGGAGTGDALRSQTLGVVVYDAATPNPPRPTGHPLVMWVDFPDQPGNYLTGDIIGRITL